MEISDIFKDHFRELSKENDFGSNRLLRDILECMSDMLKVFTWYVSKQDEDNRYVFVKEVVIPSLYILPMYFYNKKSIDSAYEKQAANIAAYTAFTFVSFEWNMHNVFETSSQVIRDILDNLCKRCISDNNHSIVYLLILLWRLSFVAEKYGLDAIQN